MLDSDTRCADGTLAVTITYLEMTERPDLPAVSPLPAGVTLTHVPAPSVRFYRYLYDAVGRDWLWWERRTYSDAKLADVIHDPDVEVHVLARHGEPIGYVELDFRTAGRANINFCGLVPEAVGGGLGKKLLGFAIARAWDRPGLAKLTLDTCTLDHPRALGFYQSFGFRPVCRRDLTIRDPRLQPGWADGPGPLAISSLEV